MCVCVSLPVGSISCSCCGNLQEVVTDTEAVHTSLEGNLTHRQTQAQRLFDFYLRRAHTAVTFDVPSVKYKSRSQRCVYLLRPCAKCTRHLDKSSFPVPLQPQKMSPPAPLTCLLYLKLLLLFYTTTTFTLSHPTAPLPKTTAY